MEPNTSILNGSVLLRDGKIAAVGASITAPPDALVIDGTGKYVTPGIIDVHSHIGVYPAPGVDANSDGNELTNPVTPTIEVGKNADVVLWSGNPFSIYSKAEKVWIDGAMLFDRDDPKERWRTDFELGVVGEKD